MSALYSNQIYPFHHEQRTNINLTKHTTYSNNKKHQEPRINLKQEVQTFNERKYKTLLKSI